jgi:predicted DCC family thiol-disulfide oxidoreductase YuxK
MEKDTMKNSEKNNKVGPSGLVVFDGSCGACSAFIGEKKAFFENYGFSVAPLQEPWVRDLLKLDEDTLLKEIHLYTHSGKIVKGIDFFQLFATKVWWLKPLGLLLRISFLKPFFAFLYRAIAQRRKSISHACGLQSKAMYSDSDSKRQEKDLQ